MCTEASYLPTGYGVYSKELLTRLNQVSEFEIAELSCYASSDNVEFKQIPWLAYANKPNTVEDMQEYEQHPTNEYGNYRFNSTCLDFKPDVVIDIRDPWMFEHQFMSPFKRFFHHLIMPTVDAIPQNPEWIDMFSEATGVMTYSDFGYQALDIPGINLLGIASPCADSAFVPLDKRETKINMGVPEGRVVGTVMRNQRRKLYPELFEEFAKLCENHDDLYLYCHTGYPDVGWEIPELLISNGLSSRVLFTYKCTNCNGLSCSMFSDVCQHCPACGEFTNTIAGLDNKLSNQELNCVYNCFDIYVQYANSEGFGMPQVEAAQAGLPVVTVGYSAMKSVADSLDTCIIPVKHLSKESETGCMRAIPDGYAFVGIMEDLLRLSDQELRSYGLNIREACLSRYNWDNTAREWEASIRNLPHLDPSRWTTGDFHIRDVPVDETINNSYDRSIFLLRDVLQRPDLVGGRLWKRLIKDLSNGVRLHSMDKFYFSETHEKDQRKVIKFSYKDAYDEICLLRDNYNMWEGRRYEDSLR